MTRDEVIVFKNYDNIGAMPHNGVGMHSSFHDLNTPPHPPARESIEVRVASSMYYVFVTAKILSRRLNMILRVDFECGFDLMLV